VPADLISRVSEKSQQKSPQSVLGKKDEPPGINDSEGLSGSGGRIRTYDLRVMRTDPGSGVFALL